MPDKYPASVVPPTAASAACSTLSMPLNARNSAATICDQTMLRILPLLTRVPSIETAIWIRCDHG